MEQDLERIYRLLLNHFGPRNWWPAKTSFEVIIGAILTQAVAWKNVVKAIGNLEAAGLLSPKELFLVNTETIEKLIKPTRYYRMKTKKLKAFINYLFSKHNGDLDQMFRYPLDQLRQELLGVYGMGDETVDAILLYAGNYPVFVVDEYTRRIFSRLGFFPERISYRKMQDFFEQQLPTNVGFFNEFHAQIDALGHYICKTKPICIECPLKGLCPKTDLYEPNKKNGSVFSRAYG